jgi:hypothetical protein
MTPNRPLTLCASLAVAPSALGRCASEANVLTGETASEVACSPASCS